MERAIPIVADEAVALDFGTGAVKVTPAHDPTDFEIALRHNLPVINILNPDCTINAHGGKYQGQDRWLPARRSWPTWNRKGCLRK